MGFLMRSATFLPGKAWAKGKKNGIASNKTSDGLTPGTVRKQMGLSSGKPIISSGARLGIRHSKTGRAREGRFSVASLDNKIMEQVEHRLAGLIGELNRISEEARRGVRVDQAQLRNASNELKLLVMDDTWLPETYKEPRPGKSIQYLLFRSPDHPFTVTTVVFDVGYTSPIHDHGTWGLVGVMHGVEREERFALSSTLNSSPTASRLVEKGVAENHQGEVSVIVPPEWEIHRISTVGQSPSCSVHVYGADLHRKIRHRYDPDTGIAMEYSVDVVDLTQKAKVVPVK